MYPINPLELHLYPSISGHFHLKSNPDRTHCCTLRSIDQIKITRQSPRPSSHMFEHTDSASLFVQLSEYQCRVLHLVHEKYKQIKLNSFCHI